MIYVVKFYKICTEKCLNAYMKSIIDNKANKCTVPNHLKNFIIKGFEQKLSSGACHNQS